MIELTVTIATAPSIAVSLDDDSASVSVSTGSVTVPVGFIGVGGGDMVASVYDPGSISGDAFSMGNMVETSASKVFTDVERSKLSNIETGATADQTASEIKTAYESRPDTNAFTDAEKSLLSDQSGVNTGDQDLSVYQIKPSEGGFVSGDKTKLDGIETGATADQTAAEIRVLVGSAHDSNVFADADRTKLDGIEAGADVTDAANVQASGAVMDSEIANLPELKSFDPLDYATSAQGSKADSAIQPGDIDTLADLNAAVSDATLIDTGDSRLSDSRAPTTHSGSHTDGTDDIQSATAAQKGLATAAHISKLNSIETGADVTDTANVVSALTPGTNITISGDGTISATGTQLSNEEVQDIVGGMVAGNAESGITVAYDDAGGKLDFTVASQTDENFTTADHAKLDGIAAGAEVNDPTTLLDSDIGSTVQGYSAALDSVSGTNTGDQDLSGYQAKPAEGAFADGDKTKLDGIETGATADQTGAEIKTAYELQANTNAFTDGDKTKLDGIETGATADQTGAEIKAAYELQANTNAFTDGDKTKLDGIETGATADQTGAEIKTAYELQANTNAFTDAEKTLLGNQSGTNTGDQDLSGYQAKPAEGAFADGDKTKLDSIEAGADITDTANVVSALTPGTNITIAGDGTISATGTQLSNEEVQDIVGGMVAGNTESGITVAYDDIGGKLDFAVASQTDENFTTADHAKLDGIEAGADVTDASNVSAAGAVMESDFSPAHSVLVQQSGTGAPTSVSIGTESLLGRTSDPGTAIASLSKTSVRAILNVENGATADQTPSEILAAIKTLDGTGSGLDADLLDGQEASAFATAAQGTLADSATQPGDNISTLTNDSGFTGDQTAADIRALGFFDASNDGAASGLDADLLDGNHASAFATAAQGSAADSALQSGDIDTLAELNSIVTDATLIDTADSRLSDSRTCDNTFDNASTSRTNLGLGTAAVESAASLSPAGGIQAYAGSSSPTGWLICDGSAVSRTTYSDLFAAISTTYGVGDGSTTFNLPDISGRVIAGKESTATLLTSGGSGVDGATLGATGGAEEHTLTEAEMPSHTHTQNYRPNTAPRSSGSTDTTSPAATTPQTGSAGGDEAHNNVQPTIILNWIIKT